MEANNEMDYIDYTASGGLPLALAQAQQPRPGRVLQKALGMVSTTAPTAPKPEQVGAQQPSALDALGSVYERALPSHVTAALEAMGAGDTPRRRIEAAIIALATGAKRAAPGATALR